MKLPARSSALYPVLRTGCTAAAVHYARGVPTPDIWAAGEAAHGMLAALARNPDDPPLKTVDRAASELMVAAPPFDGKAKPACPPQAVGRAAQLVLRWCDKHEVPDGDPEVGFAVDRNLQPVEYDSDRAAWVAILDLHRIENVYDESEGRDICRATITDAKTAWGDADPDTLQIHGQAVALLAHAGKVDQLVLEKANLPRRWLNPETYEGERLERKLDQWRDEISWWIRAWEAIPDSIAKTARPGAGCTVCPYALACKPCHDFIDASGLPDTDEARGALAARFLAVKAQLWPWLKGATEEGQEIKIPGGKISRSVSTKRFLKPGAPEAIAREWTTSGGDLEGFAAALGLGVGNLSALVKSVPQTEKQRWKEIVAEHLDDKLDPRLTVVLEKPAEPAQDIIGLLEKSIEQAKEKKK